MREGRTFGEALRERDRVALQHIAGNDAVEESPALTLFRRHRAAGEEQLRGAPLADDAWEHRAGAHIAAGEAYAREEKRGLRLGRGDPQVGEERDHRAGADADTVDGSDDRLRTGAHGFDEIAGHTGKGQQPLHVAGEQRTDDVVNVAAGGEIAAVRGNDDRFDHVIRGQAPEQVAELGIRVERQRVLSLRPRERDHANAAVDPPVEVRRLTIAHAVESFTGDKEIKRFLVRALISRSLVQRSSHARGVWARRETVQLIAPSEIGLRPGFATISELRRGVQRPIGIGEMRPGEAAQVRTSSHQDRVDVVGLVDVADGHRGDAGLVANPIGERRLEHAAVDRLGPDRRLPRRDVDDVDAGVAQRTRDADRVFRRDALVAHPVVGGNTD